MYQMSPILNLNFKEKMCTKLFIIGDPQPHHYPLVQTAKILQHYGEARPLLAYLQITGDPQQILEEGTQPLTRIMNIMFNLIYSEN